MQVWSAEMWAAIVSRLKRLKAAPGVQVPLYPETARQQADLFHSTPKPHGNKPLHARIESVCAARGQSARAGLHCTVGSSRDWARVRLCLFGLGLCGLCAACAEHERARRCGRRASQLRLDSDLTQT
eukprot:3457963-Rhodomonas_salina.1